MSIFNFFKFSHVLDVSWNMSVCNDLFMSKDIFEACDCIFYKEYIVTLILKFQ